MARRQSDLLFVTTLSILLPQCVSVPATNPYDPDTPAAQQQPALLSGQIVAEGPIDLTQAQIISATQGALGAPDEEGRFALALAAGRYEIAIQAPAHETLELGTVKLEVGEVLKLGVLRLTAWRGTLSGTATLAGQSRHGGILVSLTPGQLFAITDDTGAYTIRAVPVGNYDLAFVRSGYATRVVRQVSIEREATRSVDVELPASAGDFAINGGARYTNQRAVTLELYGADAPYAQASESSSFADNPAWQLLPTTGPSAGTLAFTLSAGEGDKSVYVRFSEDGATPAAAEPAVGSIILDATPPSITEVTIDDGRGFTSDEAGNVTLTLAAWDALSGATEVRIAIDGTLDSEAWEPIVPKKTVTLHNPTVQEEKTIKAEYRDAAGNVTDEILRTTVLDRDEPTTIGGTPAVLINAGASHTRSPVVTLSFAIAGAAFIEVGDDSSLAGSVREPYPPSDAMTWLLPGGDGTKEVWVRFSDEAGNETTIMSDQIELDTMPPQSATVIIADGAAVVADSEVSVTVQAEGATEMKLSASAALPTGTWDAYDTGAQALTLASGEGVRVAYAFFRDEAGNVTVATDTVEVDLADPAAPTVSISGPTDTSGNVFSSSLAVTVAIGRASLDADWVRIATDESIEDEEWEPYAAAKLVLLPNECGELDCNSIEVQLQDRAGRVSMTTLAHVTLDTRPPSIPVITTLPHVTREATASVSLASDASDPFLAGYELTGPDDSYGGVFVPATDLETGAPVRFSVNLKEYACSLPCTDQDLAKYDNIIRIRAYDLAGNRSPEASVTITRDTVAPPAPTLVPPSAAFVNADSLMVRLATADASHRDATFSHFELSGGALGSTWVPTTLTDLFTFGLTQGSAAAPSANVLCVHAVDKADNEGSSTCVSLSEDSVPPSKPEASPSQAIANADVVTIELTTLSHDESGLLHYELRTPDTDFTPVGAGPIFAVPLRINDDSDILVRAVDAAGNVGVAETVVITERSTVPLSTFYTNPRAPDVSGNRVVYVMTDSGVDQIAYLDFEGGFGGAITFGGNQQRFPRIGGDLVVWEDTQAGRDQVWGYGFYPAFASWGQFEIFDSATRDFGHPDTDGTYAVFSQPEECDDAAGYDTLWVWGPNKGGCLAANDYDLSACACSDGSSTQCWTLPLPTGYSKFTSCPRIACGIAVVTARKDGQNDVFAYHVASTTVTQLTSTPGVSEVSPIVSCEYAAWADGVSGPTLSVYDGLGQAVGAVIDHTTSNCPWIWGMDLSGPTLVYACYERDVIGFNIETGVAKAIDPRAGVWHGPMSADGEHIVWEEVNNHVLGHHVNATDKWLATGPLIQTTPRVAGRAVAYLEYVTSGSDKTLAVFDLDANTETAVTDQTCGTAWRYGIGAHDGNWVVAWAGADAVGTDGIYCQEQGSGTTERLRTLSRYDTNGVAVSGATTVWNEYDSSAGAQLVRMASGCPAAPVTLHTIASALQSFDPYPVIDGELVAWRESNTSIRCCDTAVAGGCDANTWEITSGTALIGNLSIVANAREGSGAGVIAWEDLTAKKIMYRPVDSVCEPNVGDSVAMTSGGYDVSSPAVSARYLLWDQEQNGRWNLVRYDFVTKKRSLLNQGSSSDTKPAVFDRTIVWEDAHTGDPDIHLYDGVP